MGGIPTEAVFLIVFAIVFITAIFIIPAIVIFLNVPEDAPTQTRTHYYDTRGRTRCRRCRKLIYSRESAERSVFNARRRGTNLRSYYETRCGNWHLTSQV